MIQKKNVAVTQTASIALSADAIGAINKCVNIQILMRMSILYIIYKFRIFSRIVNNVKIILNYVKQNMMVVKQNLVLLMNGLKYLQTISAHGSSKNISIQTLRAILQSNQKVAQKRKFKIIYTHLI